MFLNVHWETYGKAMSGPMEVLQSQQARWSKYWTDADNEDLIQHVATVCSQLRGCALEASEGKVLEGSSVHAALVKFFKDSLGADLWSATELKALHIDAENH